MPKRVDANQKPIIKALRKVPGVSARSTHMVGDGFPDIIVGYEGRNYIFELKDPNKPPSKRKLREKQKKFRDEWTGQVDTALCLTDVLKVLNGR